MRLLALAMLLAACGHDDPKAVARDPNFRASFTGSVDPKLPDGHELSISAGVDITDDLRRSVESALTTAMKTARPCMDGIYGTVFAEATFDATGKVTRAHVASPLLEGSPIAKCIETELGKMQIGRVDGAPIELRYPVRNMPSAEQMKDVASGLQKAL